jgi:hypothetical protein
VKHAADAHEPASTWEGPAVSCRTYQLMVEGELSPLAARAFAGMRVTPIAGNTVIAGPVRDQAELHAVLGRVADLGLTLVSATAVQPQQLLAGASDSPRALR